MNNQKQSKKASHFGKPLVFASVFCAEIK